jgi:hypothetical protein
MGLMSVDQRQPGSCHLADRDVIEFDHVDLAVRKRRTSTASLNRFRCSRTAVIASAEQQLNAGKNGSA